MSNENGKKVAKNVNYTPEQVEELVSAYQAETTHEGREQVVRDYASVLDKSVRSIRAKLAREGVYISKKAEASANKRETKANLVEDIAASIGRDSEALDSLEKANRNALTAIRDAVKTDFDSE